MNSDCRKQLIRIARDLRIASYGEDTYELIAQVGQFSLRRKDLEELRSYYETEDCRGMYKFILKWDHGDGGTEQYSKKQAIRGCENYKQFGQDLLVVNNLDQIILTLYRKKDVEINNTIEIILRTSISNIIGDGQVYSNGNYKTKNCEIKIQNIESLKIDGEQCIDNFNRDLVVLKLVYDLDGFDTSSIADNITEFSEENFESDTGFFDIETSCQDDTITLQKKDLFKKYNLMLQVRYQTDYEPIKETVYGDFKFTKQFINEIK